VVVGVVVVVVVVVSRVDGATVGVGCRFRREEEKGRRIQTSRKMSGGARWYKVRWMTGSHGRAEGVETTTETEE
jgi:hypothetical protein